MQIEAIGLKDINKTLQDLEDKLINTRPLINELGNHIQNVTEESFQTQTSPDGESWSPIKKTNRKKTDGSQKILYDTGHMQNSLYNYSVIGGGAVIGLNATSKGYAYPLVHQFGSKHVEARPFMPIKSNGELYEKTAKELDEIVEDYFEKMGLK